MISSCENDERMINFSDTIRQFSEASDSDILSFPPSLTGNERKIIHQVSHVLFFLIVCILFAV